LRGDVGGFFGEDRVADDVAGGSRVLLARIPGLLINIAGLLVRIAGLLV
jgi:hypothetical protein